jgi:hypothetical protein
MLPPCCLSGRCQVKELRGEAASILRRQSASESCGPETNVPHFCTVPAGYDAEPKRLFCMECVLYLGEIEFIHCGQLPTAILSLEHGNSDASSYAYAILGTVLGGQFGARKPIRS